MLEDTISEQQKQELPAKRAGKDQKFLCDFSHFEYGNIAPALYYA